MQAAVQGTLSPLSALQGITDWAAVKKVSPSSAPKNKLRHPDRISVPQAQQRASRAGNRQRPCAGACHSRRDCHKLRRNEKCSGLSYLVLHEYPTLLIVRYTSDYSRHGYTNLGSERNGLLKSAYYKVRRDLHAHVHARAPSRQLHSVTDCHACLRSSTSTTCCTVNMACSTSSTT